MVKGEEAQTRLISISLILITAALAANIPTRTLTPVSTPTPTPPPTFLDMRPELTSPAKAYPEWAHRARVAGFYLVPDDKEQNIDAELDRLIAQKVNMVLANCPLGSEYDAWVDEGKFKQSLAVVKEAVAKAHARGMKVTLYLTGLEWISFMAERGGRNPSVEHPDWVQISIEGEPIAYSDIRSEEAHWLEEGILDVWTAPSSPSFRKFYLSKIPDIVATGIDGLWIDTTYLVDGLGHHLELWPSFDRFSAEDFWQATGLDMPEEVDWDSEVWRRWIVWRHDNLRDFLVAIKEAGQEVNPDLVFFEENWSTDSPASTGHGNDPTAYTALPDVSTGHEVGTIGYRVELGQTGMQDATLEEWLSYATMIKFTRGADRDKPSWILTYGYKPADAERLAGILTANAANYYETQGPVMDGTVGADYRRRLFSWIEANEEMIYDTTSLAQVGLLYSARSRDLLDQAMGVPYQPAEFGFFAQYRAAAEALFKAHIPFDVVVDTELSLKHIGPYKWLILPNVACMSDDLVDVLTRYVAQGGNIVAVDQTGDYDEWKHEREEWALEKVPSIYIETLLKQEGTEKLIETLADPQAHLALFQTDAPPQVMLELRGKGDTLALFMINLRHEPFENLRLGMRLPKGRSVSAVVWSSPDGGSGPWEYVIEDDSLILTVPRLSIMGLARIQLKP